MLKASSTNNLNYYYIPFSWKAIPNFPKAHFPLWYIQVHSIESWKILKYLAKNTESTIYCHTLKAINTTMDQSTPKPFVQMRSL